MFNKSQFGRSMIEMLGVLAIIGVLSVGGLAGYSKAMRANKVNNAIDYFRRAQMSYIERMATNNLAGFVDGTIQCNNLLGEALPSGVRMCKCLTSPKRIYVRFNTVPLLKEFANRISGEAGNADMMTRIDTALNNGTSVTEMSIHWQPGTGKWYNDR